MTVPRIPMGDDDVPMMAEDDAFRLFWAVCGLIGSCGAVMLLSAVIG